MDYKKVNAPTNTISRDMNSLSENIGNVYETVKVIGKRANQISVEIKSELDKKLQEFASFNEKFEEFSKTESKLKFRVITRNCQNRYLSLLRNLLRTKYITVIL
jgi:DNA-directed RNA polymerase subunit K/omega